MSSYLLGNKDSASHNSSNRLQDQITCIYVDVGVAWYTSLLSGFWANSELRPKSGALKHIDAIFYDWIRDQRLESVNKKTCSCVQMLAPTREQESWQGTEMHEHRALQPFAHSLRYREARIGCEQMCCLAGLQRYSINADPASSHLWGREKECDTFCTKWEDAINPGQALW